MRILSLILFLFVRTNESDSQSFENESCINPNKVLSSHFVLNDGNRMPRIGFGTAGLGENTENSVDIALNVGFRHIDTAQALEWYRESAVGLALSNHIEKGNLNRSDVFITTKLHPRDFDGASTLKQVNKSLSNLKTDYIDLLLLHYHSCWSGLHCPGVPGTWMDAWEVLSELQKQGKIKSLGVSNFSIDQLQEMLMYVKENNLPLPSVLQIWVDPFYQSIEIRKFCQDNGIVVVSYSTLGGQHFYRNPSLKNVVLESKVIAEIAKRYQNASEVQVVLSWALQRNMGVLPRSKDASHILQNAGFFKSNASELAMFLDDGDLEVMDGLDGKLNEID